MSFDTLMMTAVKAELREQATQARVQRIYQPNREEVVFYLHRQGDQFGLILSCNARWARVHLTRQRYRHPEQPAPFCMLLRKYLVGGAIKAFHQPPLERVLEIEFKPPEGLPPVKLIAEIMGRRSNLLLVDGDGTILGAVKTASFERNPKRVIQPGEPYRPVPPQEKLDPLAVQPAELAQALGELISAGSGPEQALVKAVLGVSPLAAAELLHRGKWDDSAPDRSAYRLHGELQGLFQAIGEGRREPVLAPDRNLFACYRLSHLPAAELRPFESVNEMLDFGYHRMVTGEQTRQAAEKLRSAVNRQLARLENKLREQEKELASADEAARFRLYGELLLAYASQVPRGVRQAELPDLYHPEETVTVPLDPGLTAGANAQKHFTRYRKAQKGQTQIRGQLARTRADLDYCRGLLFTIDSGDAGSLEEIRQELVEAGYLRETKKAARRQERQPQPLSFRSAAGTVILVGRNNRQNDYLTFKTAARRDTWLHVRELPGSHVVIKEAPYPPADDDLAEAALLAAHFSRGRDSSAVAVDYTQVRHVRRGPGGKPGFALYENFHTITVNPRDERLQKLLEQQPVTT